MILMSPERSSALTASKRGESNPSSLTSRSAAVADSPSGLAAELTIDGSFACLNVLDHLSRGRQRCGRLVLVHPDALMDNPMASFDVILVVGPDVSLFDGVAHQIVPELTRESLVMLIERSIDADTVVLTLERLVAERGAPELLRCDNGPEMTAHALRDWCVLSRTGTAFIEPGSPWQNPFVESFHSRVRDELLDVEEFSCLAEARVVIGDWREDYNWRRPHSALGMKAPAVFAAEWAATSEGPTAA